MKQQRYFCCNVITEIRKRESEEQFSKIEGNFEKRTENKFQNHVKKTEHR